MRKIIPASLVVISLAWMVTIMWTSCRNENTGNPEIQIESPPSLEQPDTSKQIIQLSDNEMAELDVQTSIAQSRAQNLNIRAPGIVFPAPNHMSIISAPMDGRISKMNATDGTYVRSGSILFQMESLEFGNLISEFLQAVAEKTYHKNQLDRIGKLVEKKINSESELERVLSDYQRASASASAASAKLRAVGVTEEEMQLYTDSEQFKPILNIRAPIDGIMDQLQVDLGESVQAYETMARLIDLSHVLVRGYISPEDGQYVKTGDRVTITRRESEKQSIQATIATVNPGLDETNRSVVINIITEVRDGWPKPGENLRLEIQSDFPGKVLVIPSQAITYDGQMPVVFVKKNQNTFEMRAIVIEKLLDDFVIVRSGLSDQEEVAITQIFSLKALSRYEQIAEE